MGTVTAGISPAIGRAVLARVLAEYVEAFPHVDIRVAEDYSATLMSLLERRALDFAVLAHIPAHPTIKFTPIYQDRFVAVSSRKLGLAPYAPIRLDEEPFYKFVVPSVHHDGVRSALDVPLRTGRIKASRVIEVNSLSGVLEFVAISDWIALLPYTSIHCGLDPERWCLNFIAGEDIHMGYYVAHSTTEPVSAPAEGFIELIKQELLKIHEA
jgi:DNA-binding transcriptional LysR family regulator